MRIRTSRRAIRWAIPLMAVAIALAALFAGCVPTTPYVPAPTQLGPTVTSVLPNATGTGIAPSVVAPSPTSIPPETAEPPTETATPSATTEPSGLLKVYFIDVGQGDAEVVVSPEGRVALIDGGVVDSGVVPFLQSLGVRRIDLMVATHPHSDHIGGLVQVLSAMPVAEVVTNGQPTTTLTYEHFLDAIASAKAEYVEVKRGDSIPFGNLTFRVLNPVSNTGDDLNSNSVVLRLVYAADSFLFMGDASQLSEASILASGLPVQADVLKVGHHGSRSSSSPSFLAAVRPKIAVYSAGTGNPYGHPHPETLAALAAVGSQVYGTDVNGTIVVTADGAGGYKVEVSKGNSSRAPPIPSVTGTETPTSSDTTGPLLLEIVSVTSPVAPGGRATLVAHTVPGAQSTIKVYYKSGPSKASGLSPQAADTSGNVSWSWMVGRSTTPGNWRIVVTASAGGQTVTEETYFKVAK